MLRHVLEPMVNAHSCPMCTHTTQAGLCKPGRLLGAHPPPLLQLRSVHITRQLGRRKEGGFGQGCVGVICAGLLLWNLGAEFAGFGLLMAIGG